MNNPYGNQSNYWSGVDKYSYEFPKPKRSFKKKLFIVISFVSIIAITPSLIFTLSNIDLSKNNAVIITSNSQDLNLVEKNEPEIHKVTIEEPSLQSNQAIVIANDSYWKISKRICDTGKYYLSIKDQNDAKALFEGDTVIANCTI